MLNETVSPYGFGMTSNSSGGVMPTPTDARPENRSRRSGCPARGRGFLQIVEPGDPAEFRRVVGRASRNSCVTCSYSWSMSITSTSCVTPGVPAPCTFPLPVLSSS